MTKSMKFFINMSTLVQCRTERSVWNVRDSKGQDVGQRPGASAPLSGTESLRERPGGGTTRIGRQW